MAITSYIDMKEKRKQLKNRIRDLKGITRDLKEFGLSITEDALSYIEDKLENDNFKVLVIGEFKNGKSTFINALMGDKILPAYSTPCTAVINEVIYGEDKKARLYFKNPLPNEISADIENEAKLYIAKYKDSGEIPFMELDIDKLADYVVIPDPSKDQADSIKESPYSKVVLEYPIGLCNDGIKVIDSPGLNEHGTRTKVTEEYLNQADAIIFVCRCPKIGSVTEIDYIKNKIHAMGHKDIFFVCNAINQVPEEEQDRLISFGDKKLSSLTSLGRRGIFYLDALNALKAKQAKDRKKLESTGMVEFEDALSDYLRNNKGKTKLLQIIMPALVYMETIKSAITAYKKYLEEDIDKLISDIKIHEPKLEIAELRKCNISKAIEEWLEDIQKDISNLMEEQYKNIIDKIPETIKELDIDNKMSINPFKQKDTKETLEKEVAEKLNSFFEEEMGRWVQEELRDLIEESIEDLKEKIGKDIDLFYERIDEFRYDISGVEQSKNISGFSRLAGTIVGTVIGGPMYGAIGATQGFGETLKKSAVTMAAVNAIGALFAFTPVGAGTILTISTVAMAGSGLVQLVGGGKSLTDKYKEKLADSFKKELGKNKDESSKQYAEKIVQSLKEELKYIEEGLNNEIKAERKMIKYLKSRKQNSEQEKEIKFNELIKLETGLDKLKATFLEMERAIG